MHIADVQVMTSFLRLELELDGCAECWPAFYPLYEVYGLILMWIPLRSLIHSHMEAQPVFWWSRTCLPKINKSLFQSLLNKVITEDIYYVSAYSVAVTCLSLDYSVLLSDMHRVGMFLKVCVCVVSSYESLWLIWLTKPRGEKRNFIQNQRCSSIC